MGFYYAAKTDEGQLCEVCKLLIRAKQRIWFDEVYNVENMPIGAVPLMHAECKEAR